MDDYARNYALRFVLRHLQQAERWDEVQGLLTDLRFLEAKTQAGLVFELARDYNEVAERLPASEPDRRILQLLGAALRRDIHFIHRHTNDYPQVLFQCLWNTCWWYDCEEAATHYVEPHPTPPQEQQGPCPETQQLERRVLKQVYDPKISPPEKPTLDQKMGIMQPADQKLYRLLERWRDLKLQASPGLSWMRAHRPPFVRLSTAERAVLYGHDGRIMSVMESPNGRRIVSGSCDRTVRVWDAETGAELAVLRGHEGDVLVVACSPDGRRIVSGSADGTIRAWDATSGAELGVWRLRGHRVTSLAYSADGRRVVSASNWLVKVRGRGRGRTIVTKCTAQVWDAESGAEIVAWRAAKCGVSSVAYSPDGRWIVSGSNDNTVRVWDAERGTKCAVLRFLPSSDAVISVASTPRGCQITSRYHDGIVLLLDVATGTGLNMLGAGTGVTCNLVGRRIAIGPDNTIRVCDVESGAELAVLPGHEGDVHVVALSPDGRVLSESWESSCCWGGVHVVAFSPDGRRIAIGSTDGTIRVRDTARGTVFDQFEVWRVNGCSVTSLAYSPDGRWIVSGSNDNTVRIWDAKRGTNCAVLRFPPSSDAVTSVKSTPGGWQITNGSRDSMVLLLDVVTSTGLNAVGARTGVTCNPVGRRIAIGTDNTIRVCDAETGAEPAVLPGHEGDVRAVAFSPDGRRIAIVRNGNSMVRICDAESGADVAVLRGPSNDVRGIAYSPDGRQIASADAWDKTVRVWDAESGAKLAVLYGHTSAVNGVAYSPDGQHIVSCASDATIRVWDTVSGREIAVLRGHVGNVLSVAYSEDGQRIISGSADLTIRVWDAKGYAMLAVLGNRVGYVYRVCGTADGRRIITDSRNGMIRVWDARSGDCLEIIEGACDMKAIAAGASRFPLRAIARGHATIIEQVESGKPIAWFPTALAHIVTHPSGRTWAGAVGNHVYIIRLEGVPDPTRQQDIKTP